MAATNEVTTNVRVSVTSVALGASVLIGYSFFSRIVVLVARLVIPATTARLCSSHLLMTSAWGELPESLE